MKSKRTGLAWRSLGKFSMTSVLLFTIAGCSDTKESREYTIPETLCGVPITPEKFDALFPPGKEIKVTKKNYSTTETCNIAVDKTSFATTTQAWLEEGRGTAFFASSLSLDPPKKATQGDRYRYSDREGFGKAQGCTDSQYKQELYTAVQIWNKKYKDTNAMKDLIITFTEKVEETDGCTAGIQE